jgi:diguanylate cyclase (GGDEF)-like protein/PAS domain S-box-containing protein
MNSDSNHPEKPMASSMGSAGDAIAERADLALTVVNRISAMVAYWDRNQVCLFSNNAHTEWFGKTPDQIVGKTMQELLGARYEPTRPYIAAALDGRNVTFERTSLTPGGKIRHSLVTYTPDMADGAVRGFVVHVADVTAMKALEMELQAAKARAEKNAAEDFLTGLPNRMLLEDQIKRALSAARRNGKAVALMTIDIDDFKTVNDTYGHTEGDHVLKAVAQRVKETIRDSDSLTRLGGDEFVLLAPDVEPGAQLDALLERVLDRVRQPIHRDAYTLHPACSIGVALYPQDGPTMEELMTKSDRALYAAKKRGKCCFEYAGRIMP